MGEPARGYKWEDAKPGNTIALKHGAYSPRVVLPLAQELVDQVLKQATDPASATSYLADVTYRPALWDWAVARARVERLHTALVQHGDCHGCKSCGRWDAELDRWMTRAASLAQRLGLDPLSRARLGRDVVAAQTQVAMARLQEQGAALVEQYDPQRQGGEES